MPPSNNTSNGLPRPFIKWAGGKSSLVVEFEKKGLLPKQFNDYYEPFMGGGAVFFYLYNKGLINSNSFLSDVNKELVNVYNEIKQRPKPLIVQLKTLEDKYSSELFYQFRIEYNELKIKESSTAKEKTRKAALLIYLNKTCFNGLYRENKSGGFNVPFGDYENPRILDEPNILAVSTALKNTTISKKDFADCLKHAKEGDFVYFDPPYHPMSETASFTSYSEGDFGFDEQKRLSEVFSKLTEKKVLVLLSNSSHDEIKKLYERIEGAYLNTVNASRYISCKGSGRKPVLEYAITNFKPVVAQKRLEIS